ncbi:hypothetical protein ACFLZH_01480 [Patescibacteria group bacterium]
MKRSLVYIGNILAIIIGLLGLGAPLITPGFIAIGLGGFLDPALLQPLFIGLIVLAIIGQFYKARETLGFMSLILEFVIGVVSFIFIFPVKIEIVGYLGLAGIVYIMVWPFLSKKLNKRKVVKIKA